MAAAPDPGIHIMSGRGAGRASAPLNTARVNAKAKEARCKDTLIPISWVGRSRASGPAPGRTADITLLRLAQQHPRPAPASPNPAPTSRPAAAIRSRVLGELEVIGFTERPPLPAALKELNRPLMLLGGRPAAERTQVAPFAGPGILLLRIEPELTRSELTDHRASSRAILAHSRIPYPARGSSRCLARKCSIAGQGGGQSLCPHDIR